MKITIIATFLLLFIVGKGHTQLLEIGDKWIYDTRDFSIGGGHYSEKFDSIEIVSDTIINGLQYFKLVASEENPCGTFLHVEYLRQEDEKVYRLSRNLSDENLMIDYSIQDSYDMTYEVAWFNMEVQTTVINDSNRVEMLPSGDSLELTYQHILNNYSFEDEAIFKLSKEIGYLQYGFLFPSIGTGLCDISIGLRLRCKISGNDTIRVTEFDCFESSIKVSVNESYIEEDFLYPNPTNGIVNISGSFESVEVLNTSGQICMTTIQNNQVDLSLLPSGLYFVRVNKKGREIRTYRIVKL